MFLASWARSYQSFGDSSPLESYLGSTVILLVIASLHLGTLEELIQMKSIHIKIYELDWKEREGFGNIPDGEWMDGWMDGWRRNGG